MNLSKVNDSLTGISVILLLALLILTSSPSKSYTEEGLTERVLAGEAEDAGTDFSGDYSYILSFKAGAVNGSLYSNLL